MLGSILVKKPHYWAVAAAIKVVWTTISLAVALSCYTSTITAKRKKRLISSPHRKRVNPKPLSTLSALWNCWRSVSPIFLLPTIHTWWC
ncbi:Uncharacterised protein [Vibrio cholerae]|nr:Uncharacterised protein [Vibrio cholerae]